MKKWLLALALGLSFVLAGGFCFSACDKAEEEGGVEWTLGTVYAQAQELGYEGTLDEFIALISGRDGADGQDGEDGKDGADGVGVQETYVDEDGHLIVVLTNGKTVDCGAVKGADGQDGEDGKDGADGVGVQEAYVDENGHLIVVLTNGKTVDCGAVKGADGQNGQDGVGIKNLYINAEGRLIAELTDGRTIDCGSVWGGSAETEPESIRLNTSLLTIDEGKSAQLTATVLPEEAADKRVTWSSLNENVATVEDGRVYGVSAGETSILAVTSNGKVASCTVRVLWVDPGFVEVTGITLDKSALTLSAGSTGRLTASVQPANATQTWLTWTSSNEEIVAVGDGVLYALQPGSASVTVSTENGKTASCTITVTDDPRMEGFTYRYFNNWDGTFGCEVTGVQAGYQGRTALTIPAHVTSVSFGALQNCRSLTELTIPVSDRNLGWYFGAESSADSDVYLPLPLKKIVFTGSYIHSSAYENCTWLEEVVLPDSVTSIGDRAFSGCSSLASVVIPGSVTSIGWAAFSGCSSLASVAIPGSVTSIGNSTFSGCSSLASVVIPDSVTSIGLYAFSGCSSLESVVIPDSVTSIGDRAFYGCNGLRRVNIGDLNAWLAIDFGGEYANPLNYAHDLYLNGVLVKEVTVPAEQLLVKAYAFAGSSIRRVVMEEGIRAIRASAFQNCSSLASVVIPDSVTSIGERAFSGCSSLESVVIPDSVTSIGDWAFSGCSSLASVVIPDSVTSIGERAFSGCSSLESVVIPDSVTSIGNEAFFSCSSLASVVIPDSVTSIGSSAFHGCSSLTSVVIPDSVTSIGELAFAGCSSLASVTFATPNDWYAGDTAVDSAVLADPALAADYLRDIAWNSITLKRR